LTSRSENTNAFVLCKCGEPLMPTTAPKARILLKRNKAQVFRLHPFTIKLNYETPHLVQPIDCRVDYGANRHGIALVQHCKSHDRVIFFGEARQRLDIKKKLDIRRGLRRNRRYRNTRYRQPRSHRRRSKGYVPPTIGQRVETVMRITKTLNQVAPTTSAVVEIGMFDTQRMINPEIKGVEYQQGPKPGYDNRRHAVLAYFNYTCQYCGGERGVMTEEHVIPRGRGGTDAWCNLTCACLSCNIKKGDRTPEEAGMPSPRTVNPRNMAFQKFCAIVQSGKNMLVEELTRLMPTQTVYGWQTKQNREAAGLPKTHYFDALCTKDIIQRLTILSPHIYEIRLRRRNVRRIHAANPNKGGKRARYNANKDLEGFEKGDLIMGPHGLGYIDSIKTRGQLTYRSRHGQRYSVSPGKAKLLESVKSVAFLLRTQKPV
jgi:hypothetical protein